MPYASNKQAAFMHIHHPEITQRWHESGHGYVKGGKNDPNKKKRRRVSKGKSEWPKVIAGGTVAGALANQFPRVQDVVTERKRKKGRVKKMAPPTWPDDGFFNAKAAQKTFDLIMKMDDDTAEVFCHVLASDLLEQEVERNRVTLQKHLDEVIAKRMEMAKRAVIRATAADQDEQAVDYAKALRQIEEISKADPEIPNWAFERKIRRDPRTGRFGVKISTRDSVKPLKPKAAAGIGIAGTDDSKYGKMTDKQKAQYQQEYMQLANFLQSVSAVTGDREKAQVRIHFRDESTDEEWSDVHTGGRPPKSTMLDPNVRVVGATAAPEALTVGGAAFSLAGAMQPATMRGINTGVEQFERQGGFRESWLSAGEAAPGSSNARLYGRTQALGEMAGALGPPGSKTQLAGKMAEIVGQYGPQAEEVLGPTARKTAYRYRGTERTPDKRLVSAYATAIDEGKRRGPQDKWAEKEELRLREVRRERGAEFTETAIRGKGTYRRPPGKPAESPSISQVASQRQARAERAPEWLEREPGRQAVTQYLEDRLPSKKLYRLQLEAGTTPPSEGVIINSDGQIVTQAVGYGDDHYLPFNLKNLKGLKGGEYIRNRSVGGLTSEDIYTGLISGARRVTVVSRSGTFTMEFQPDFRGGRRHNDKARRMTRRYEQILDAVQSEQVERQDVPVRWRKIIEQEVRDEYPPGTRQSMLRAEIDARIKEFKDNPKIEGRDLDRAETAISAMEDRERLGLASKQDVADFRKEIMNELQDMKEIKFRLNGVGYKAALDSLTEQFPYYIHSESKPKEEHLLSFELDRGYVEPGRNRPTAAKAGWHGTQRGKTGKFSAARANYQRGLPGAPEVEPGPTQQPRTRGGEVEESTSSSGSSRSPGTLSERDRHREAMQEAAEKVAGKRKAREAAVALQAATRNQSPPAGETPEWWGMSSEDFRDYVADQSKLAKFNDFVDQNRDALNKLSAQRLLAYTNAMGGLNPVKYQKEKAAVWPTHPYTFKDKGPAFRLGARPEEMEHEIRRIDSEDWGLVHNKPLSEYSNDQMRDEVEQIATVMEGMSAQPGLGAEEYQATFGSFFAAAPQAYLNKLFRPGGTQAHLERIHQMRWLKAHHKPQAGPGPAAPPRPASPPSGGGGGGSAPVPTRPTPGPSAQPAAGRLKPLSEEEVNAQVKLVTEQKNNYIRTAEQLANQAEVAGDNAKAEQLRVLSGDLKKIPRQNTNAQFDAAVDSWKEFDIGNPDLLREIEENMFKRVGR